LARVELRGIAKNYPGGIEAIRPLDLTINEGELFVIVGPSGSGKTTLLRLIAGLEPPGAGSLWIDSRRADRLPPRDRDLAMVFQSPVVYPFLSVYDNLAFGLRAMGGRLERNCRDNGPGSRAEEVEQAVVETAALLCLTDILKRRPATLSGGQRQRVALGRALVRRPGILLLDEPFASLDAPLREALRAELLELQRRLGTTMVHVTHDQAEALALATRLAVLKEGRIVQTGAPLEVYEHPACRFVGEFIGSPPMNILPCAIETVGATVQLRIDGVPEEQAPTWMVDESSSWAAPLLRRGPGPIDLGLRAEHVHRSSVWQQAGLAARGSVRRIELHGTETRATLGLGPHALTLSLPARTPVAVGTPIDLALDPEGIVWFDRQSGVALR
jgi:ABC-type sugar transport system ATPase subunit